jgi:hypothetical protein
MISNQQNYIVIKTEKRKYNMAASAWKLSMAASACKLSDGVQNKILRIRT